MFNHWAWQSMSNETLARDRSTCGKCEFQQMRGLYRKFQRGKFGAARVDTIDRL